MQQYQYETRPRAFSTKFLTSQADSLVLAPRLSTGLGTQFVLKSAEVQNRSGSTSAVGIGGRLPIALWEAGHWDQSDYAAGTVYTDDTVDAQDAGTSDFALGTISVNDDGFVIGCDVPFNIVSVMVGTATLDGSPVFDLAYTIATAGTGESNNFKVIINPLVAPLFTSTGEQLIWFAIPTDWVAVTAATAVVDRHGKGMPEKFCLRIRQTTAGTTAIGDASLLILGHMVNSLENLADNNGATWGASESEFTLLPQCDAIAAAISTANNQNLATVSYRMKG